MLHEVFVARWPFFSQHLSSDHFFWLLFGVWLNLLTVDAQCTPCGFSEPGTILSLQRHSQAYQFCFWRFPPFPSVLRLILPHTFNISCETRVTPQTFNKSHISLSLACPGRHLRS